MLTNEQIVYVGNDWFADNRTSSHQIARLLAERNRMLYVEAAGQRAPTASRRDLAKIARKLGKAWADPLPVDGMHLFSPLIVPYHGLPMAGRLNRALLASSLRRACRKVGFDNPILWIILPHYASLAQTLPSKGVVYYVVDEYASMPGVDQARIRAMERLLLDRADVVFTISEELTRAKGAVNPHTYLSPHGVDTAHFNRAYYEDLPRPPELGEGSGPVVGFFGLIEDWLDLELVGYLAGRRPEYTFVMVGRVASDVAGLAAYPNVRFLGQRPYEEIPRYLRWFDVCHIPFKLNEVIVNSSPLKLKEYLAGGKPVVSVAINEVKKYEGLAFVAETYEQYLAHIDRALAEDSPAEALRRVRAMEGESWRSKIDTISQRVSAHIPGVRNE
ncbi:MAG: glycosyltransferase [Gemmatimonadota bacterium]|nr:glycosyltransferase [Gemmatimonadota bacterium]